MEKIMLIAALLATTLSASAQIVSLKSSDNNDTDTLTNASTIYMTTPVGALNNAKSGKYDVQVAISNVSGTTAGTVIVEGSINGIDWEPIHKTTRGVDGVHCDSLTFAAAVSHTYNIYPGSTKYYAGTATTNVSNAGRKLRIRLKIVGTGTQSSIVSAKLIFTE